MAGCVHIYCGDGKGKTTASIGLAVRAAGCGKKVLITRFLKTDHSGEVDALASIPEITVTPCEKSFGFFAKMTPEQKSEAGAYYEELLKNTLNRAVKDDYEVVVLDEIMAVCNFGLVREQDVLDFLSCRPPEMEVILTGRDPSVLFKEKADYISEIRKIKHPYDRGLVARRGIEY